MPRNTLGYPEMPTQHDSKHEELDYFPKAEQGPAPMPAKLHRTTFEYLKPSDEQVKVMSLLRTAARQYSDMLEEFLPNGPDKTFILRQHRQNAMWVNVAVTRFADGAPRP